METAAHLADALDAWRRRARDDEHAATHASATSRRTRVSDSARIEARGHLDRVTKQPAFVKVEATVDGRVVARGQYISSRSSAPGRLEVLPRSRVACCYARGGPSSA